jgi:hypothetical protein
MFNISTNQYFHGGFKLPEWMRIKNNIIEELDYNNGYSCNNCIYGITKIQCPKYKIEYHLNGKFLFCENHIIKQEPVKHTLREEEIKWVEWIVRKIKKDNPEYIEGYIMDHFPETILSEKFFEEVYKKSES